MIKKFETGLVIGKFFPLHKGHQYLIDTALEQVKELTIIVCHCDKYNIDPEIRAAWIRELYPSARVIIFRHKKYLDSTSLKLSPLWASITKKLLGFVPEAVFSSETYGQSYATSLGSTHILVDIKRKKYSVSGTLVRDNPFKYWQYLSEPVRGYFAKRVVVLGAESTGTTSLAKSLAKHYHTSWAPEYGRTYTEGKITAKDGNSWTADEFIHIALVQNSLEDFLARKSNKLLICDTDAFATRLWFERYLGYLYPPLDKITNTQNKSLYILTGDEIPFVQDGTRDGEHIRHQMHQRFIEELNRFHLNYILVKGSRTQRKEQAIRAIDKLFPEK